MKVAFQMDPIMGVDIDADSTFRIAEEAQARGHRLFYYTPEKLAYDLLSGLDLGPKLTGPDAVGELKLEHGATMVSSYSDLCGSTVPADLRRRCSIIRRSTVPAPLFPHAGRGK